jgi:hypothetical protein
MTSNHHAPYVQGYTRVTMGLTTGRLTAMFGKSLKQPLSSDRSLQLDSVKSESLVNADQHAALNTFPGLVHTARHTTRMDHAQSRYPNLREGAAKGRVRNWGEVVTR